MSSDVRLSLPSVRVIFTRQASPRLASHAPNDSNKSAIITSVSDCMNNDIEEYINSPRVIASKFSKHIRKFFCVRAKASKGIIIIIGNNEYGIG